MLIIYKSFKLVCISLCLLAVSCAELPYQRPALNGQTPEDKLASAEKAYEENSSQPAYRSDLLNQQDKTTRDLLIIAEQSRNAGKWEEAVICYLRVLQVDKNNIKARNALKEIEIGRRHERLVDDAKKHLETGEIDNANSKLQSIFLENPAQQEALLLKAKIDNIEAAKFKIVVKPNPNLSRNISLEFRNANIKLVFEALSRDTGINFVLDKDIRPDAKTTIYVKNVTLEQALSVIFASNQLQKKLISENTILIYPNTVQKARNYQELVIKSFYLVNADVKQTASLLRSMLKVRDMHVDERLSLLVLRDTAENVRLAEKLVALQDTAEPEVMLEVEVLEITRSTLSNLGIQFPNQATVNALGVDGNLTALTVEALRNLSNNNILLTPNPALNLRKDDGAIDLLANPRIRVKNREKAKVQIGDRIPIITSNVTGTAATVSETVQYIDVGLKLEVQPMVSLDEYVSIKIGLEVSSLGKPTLTKNGSVVYQIGTRNANTLLRLKDGETQILAGLINDNERKDASKFPGLSSLPLIGRLFFTERKDKFKTEIVLAITPHVINNIRRPNANLLEFWSGTEAVGGNTSSGISNSGVLDISLSANQNTSDFNETETTSFIDTPISEPISAGSSNTNISPTNSSELSPMEFDR